MTGNIEPEPEFRPTSPLEKTPELGAKYKVEFINYVRMILLKCAKKGGDTPRETEGNVGDEEELALEQEMRGADDEGSD